MSFPRIAGALIWLDPFDPSTSYAVPRYVLALLFFTFTTLTTLGYGDIAGATPVAKNLSVLEAIIGQIYLVVLVARLVGMEISHSSDKGPS